MTDRCPDLETLGAFLEGRLEGAERDAIAVHLATCDACIAGAAFVREMRAEPQYAAPNVVPLVRRRGWPWLAAAALLVLVAGAAAVLAPRLLDRRRAGIAALIAAAPSTYRVVEPRVSGFRWAELQRMRADDAPADPEALKLGGAAADVLVRARRDGSPEASHAAGVAELLLQRPGEAAERLRAVAAKSEDAAVWNDLAAAQYASALREGRHADLPRALASADRAIELDPRLAEARFNRALILERLGLRTEAAAAWREYLQHDPSSAWAAEARQHLQSLDDSATARPSLERLEQAAAARDRRLVDTLVRSAPQEARAWFETDVLGRWGETAAANLVDASLEAGAALQRFSGESLLVDAANAIRAADEPSRRVLANAHARYRRGRLLYRDRRLADAVEELLAAAAMFDHANSPMNGVARFFAACALFDDNRVDDAARLLRGIAPAPRHHALRAQTAHRLALCDLYAGRPEEAIRGFAEAAELFERLHEHDGLAQAKASLGNAFDELGARDDAWAQRIAALELYSRGSRQRLIGTLAAAVRGEQRADEWEAARSLLAIEAAEATALGDPLLVADVWRRRALTDARLGHDVAARESIARGRDLIARAAPSGVRERLAAETSLAEAAVHRAEDPRRALTLVDESIRFLAASEHRIALPDAFLERGRTLRAAGRADEALRELEKGLAEIELQRRAAPAGSAIFDAVTPLVEETIALQLARGDAAAAFDTAERAHARALLDGSDGHPATAAEVAAALPADAMLIAYALQPDGVVALCITRRGAEFVRQTVERRELAAAVRALRTSIAARADLAEVKERAAALDRLLLAPIPGVRQASSLVIVPDRFLHALPWAVLYDAERSAFRIEEHALTVAPSAALWLRRKSQNGAAMLVVSSAAAANRDPLDHAAAEGTAIADAYAERLVLDGKGSTPAGFLSMAARADVVHFAGHARLGPEPALLMGEHGELRASEIAAAGLTRPRLVVLAACGTAAGSGSGFDGPRGLARAFLTAGVTAVVGTLWPIDDAEASRLFLPFHRRLGEGDDAAAALRHAQLSLLRGEHVRSRHPAAWAAAELFGANVSIR